MHALIGAKPGAQPREVRLEAEHALIFPIAAAHDHPLAALPERLTDGFVKVHVDRADVAEFPIGRREVPVEFGPILKKQTSRDHATLILGEDEERIG